MRFDKPQSVRHGKTVIEYREKCGCVSCRCGLRSSGPRELLRAVIVYDRKVVLIFETAYRALKGFKVNTAIPGQSSVVGTCRTDTVLRAKSVDGDVRRID